jgi:hypothetical protein
LIYACCWPNPDANDQPRKIQKVICALPCGRFSE